MLCLKLYFSELPRSSGTNEFAPFSFHNNLHHKDELHVKATKYTLLPQVTCWIWPCSKWKNIFKRKTFWPLCIIDWKTFSIHFMSAMLNFIWWFSKWKKDTFAVHGDGITNWNIIHLVGCCTKQNFFLNYENWKHFDREFISLRINELLGYLIFLSAKNCICPTLIVLEVSTSCMLQ